MASWRATEDPELKAYTFETSTGYLSPESDHTVSVGKLTASDEELFAIKKVAE